MGFFYLGYKDIDDVYGTEKRGCVGCGKKHQTRERSFAVVSATVVVVVIVVVVVVIRTSCNVM